MRPRFFPLPLAFNLLLLTALLSLPVHGQESSEGSTGSSGSSGESGSEGSQGTTGSGGGDTTTYSPGTTDLGGGTVTLLKAIFNGGSVTNGTLSASSEFEARNGSVTAVLTGTATLTKTFTTDPFVLSSASTYTGNTTISVGTLQLGSAGSIASSPRITIASGATFDVSAHTGGYALASGQTLGGTGTVTGPLIVGSGATLAPGSSPGTLNAGDTTFAGGGIFNFEVNSTTGTLGTDPGWDLLAISGGLTISANSGNPFIIDLDTLTLANVAGVPNTFLAGGTYTFTFLTTTTGITSFDTSDFTFNTAGVDASLTGTWSLALSGNNLDLRYASAIPEPSACALGLAGAGLLAVLVRRRRSGPPAPV